jgi:large subunit ribosomal protein L19e
LNHPLRYHEFYLGAKGNQYKNKKVLIEQIHISKAEKIRQEKIDKEQDTRRNKY